MSTCVLDANNARGKMESGNELTFQATLSFSLEARVYIFAFLSPGFEIGGFRWL
jgi:hypothetical protein